MSDIKNPILTGFHPDPCLIRVEDDYYLITSTFEWWPGIPVYHSKDLKNWQLLTHVLTEGIDFRGNPDSCSVWAPAISYDKGQFYIVYTDVKRSQYPFKDAHNYLMTSTDIMGPWSEPIYLNSGSFDPSLFHDEDGKKWYLDVDWDYRATGRNKSTGITMQEYCANNKKLVGPIYKIFTGTHLKKTEASHIYKHKGYYYLLTAEGGTGITHGVTVARSKCVTGPYEVDPQNPMLTAAHDETIYLQKSGHASLVCTQTDEWYIAHLCSRPVKGKFSILGRETALQRVVWTEDGWLRLECVGHEPQTNVKAPNLPEHPFLSESLENDEFDADKLSKVWYTPRKPIESSWCNLSTRPGYVRLKGGESIHSLNQQHLIARRQQHFNCEVETCLEFNPETHLQMAGVVLYYNTSKYVYLYLSSDEKQGVYLNVMQSVNGEYELLDFWVPIERNVACRLKAKITEDEVEFFFAQQQNDWQPVGQALSISHLSDESGGFTGNFIGICVQDLRGTNLHGDFDYFYYQGKDDA